MNQYLLLRDNKQTGPYSKEELIEKGLKKYDLVWLEGRSAAWRYPCEFDELKPYAPEVEEQPFDRFYKRPADTAQHTTAEIKQLPEEKTATQPVSAKNADTGAAKHIYVTMPDGKANTAQKEEIKKEEKPQPAVQKEQQPQAKKSTPATTTYLVSEEDDELNSALLKGYNSKKKEETETNHGFLNEYEARKAAYQAKKTGDVKPEPVPEKKEKPAPVAAVQKTEAETYTKPKERKELFTAPRIPGNFFQDNKMLTRGLLAACLILGGVVIGLIINSNKHRPADTQVLETLVKEIREQQKDKSATSSTEPAPNNKETEKPQDDLTNNDNLNNYTEQPSNNAALGAEPNARHAVIKKDNNAKDTKTVAVPVSNTEPERVEPQPVHDNKEKINQETIEKARKNIYDLVGLEASQYKVGLLGGISDLDITISNNSLYALDQVAVEIKYFGPEKKLVKTQTIVFNHVPAGKQRTLEAPRTNRGISIDYAITGINSKALGLAQASY